MAIPLITKIKRLEELELILLISDSDIVSETSDNQSKSDTEKTLVNSCTIISFLLSLKIMKVQKLLTVQTVVEVLIENI